VTFRLGGALSPEDPSYVARSFEDDLYSQLIAGNWVLLLGPRQHGKSSALARLRSRLRDDGVASAVCDLQAKPQINHYRELLAWVAARIADESGKPVHEPAEDTELGAWLEPVLPDGDAPFVLIVDEASAISDPDDRNLFYSQFRAIKNKQAIARFPEFPTRLRCVFVGTFRHQTMVYDSDNSPFNVSYQLESTDFTLDEARELWEGVTGSPTCALTDAAYELVGGQPYLLQYLYSAIDGPLDQRDTRFQTAAGSLSAGEHPHTQSVFREVIDDERLKSIVDAMVEAGSEGVQNRPAQIDYQYLRVLGIARRSEENNRLVFRNPLYTEIAAAEFGNAGNAGQRRYPF